MTPVAVTANHLFSMAVVASIFVYDDTKGLDHWSTTLFRSALEVIKRGDYKA
jgi:hypothetical protein